MDAQIKDKWLEALGSGRYNHGKYYLKKSIEGKTFHCCLGVLCEMLEIPSITLDVDVVYAYLEPTEYTAFSLTAIRYTTIPPPYVHNSMGQHSDYYVNALSSINDAQGTTNYGPAFEFIKNNL